MTPRLLRTFQCSSASRKFLKLRCRATSAGSFAFQCSSASRKFLKSELSACHQVKEESFSALQRAENSSNTTPRLGVRWSPRVSVLFSEPKIPQSENHSTHHHAREKFQCSSASRKFLKGVQEYESAGRNDVSVLFSEPKIPQRYVRGCWGWLWNCFSALQRAENSSNEDDNTPTVVDIKSFSALQRAENSSKTCCLYENRLPEVFQCSSASRKFLKPHRHYTRANCASSMFQCSSASRKFLKPRRLDERRVARDAFQCSSASRKFLKRMRKDVYHLCAYVSVLFSEPKIPQTAPLRIDNPIRVCFSALQRAENSSNPVWRVAEGLKVPFQCSSASRKFLKRGQVRRARAFRAVSVLFSEPKIPQRRRCVSRSTAPAPVSVLFSEPKIPQKTLAALYGVSMMCFSALQRAENSSKNRTRCST